MLTGITDAMVIDKPRIAEVLPSFLEFARGTVLVAHNAPFDTGFLKHFSRELGIPWPRFEVLDTAVLARRTLLRDEVPNVRLATLARVFHATTTPNHRALSDARATVDVLHGLFERLGPLGVTSLEEVATFTARVTPAQRKKRHLAEHLPQSPGVYLFRDRPRRRPLRRHVPPAPVAGPFLLHRVRDAHADGRDGAAGPARGGHRLCHDVWRRRCASCG